MASLVKKLRWQVRDRARYSRITDAAGINSSVQTITLPAGHVASLIQTGNRLEFDDDTDEEVLVTSTDPSANTVAVLRGQNGTTAVPHLLNTGIVIEPTYSYVVLGDALSDVVETELWPIVWTFGEATFTYEADGHYSPVATGIEAISWVYQLSGGEVYPLEYDWQSPEITDTTNFPNGMLIVPETADASTLYVAYRQRPAVATLSDRLLRLASYAVMAQVVEMREVALVGPDATASERGLQEGSRARSASVLWRRFEQRRWQEHVSLTEDEETRRPF